MVWIWIDDGDVHSLAIIHSVSMMLGQEDMMGLTLLNDLLSFALSLLSTSANLYGCFHLSVTYIQKGLDSRGVLS